MKNKWKKIILTIISILILAGLCYGAVGGLIVIYIGALLPVNAPRFILLSTLFRFPGIITTTISGEFFTQGNNRTALIVYAVTFVVSLLILWHFSRKEEIREIMDINKDK